MTLDTDILRFLSKDTQLLLKNNWEGLSLEAKKLIIKELENMYDYEQRLIAQALENNPDFFTAFEQKSKQLKASYISKIEQQEDESEGEDENIDSLL